MTSLRNAAVVLLLVASTSCLHAPDAPGPALGVIGREERGGYVIIGTADEMNAGVSESTIVFNPANAAVWVDSVQKYRWSITGRVSVSRADGTMATTVVVAKPPTILFDMVSGGNRDIYSMSLDGLDLKRLTTDPASDAAPTAAGNTVVFISFRDGNGELYSCALTGASGDTRLSTTAVNESAPRLSTNGQRLAYIRDDGGTPHVWIAAGDGGNPESLGALASVVEGSPVWLGTATDSLFFSSTAFGASAIVRSGAAPGSVPIVVVAPSTSSQVYVEPTTIPPGVDVVFAAATAGGPARLLSFNRVFAITLPLTSGLSVGQPVGLTDGRTVFTVFGAGGSSTLAMIDLAGATTGVIPIPVTGTNPQHPAIIWP